MHVGLLGGTFNPVHNGHLHIADAVLKSCGLDQVWFVPAWQPPHKEVADEVSFEHRLAMVTLALQEFPAFRVCDVEGRRGGTSFTVDTLQQLRREYPDHEFFFIMGLDSFRELHLWRNYQQLFTLAHIVVTARPGFSGSLQQLLPVAIADRFCYDPVAENYRYDSGFSVTLVDHTDHPAASTEIRQAVRNHQDINGLVPEAVATYIHDHHLYVND